MNSYLYAPKDDPYHREKWMEPYPAKEWGDLKALILIAQASKINFIYGFHPGKGLHFSLERPVKTLLEKAQRFYDIGVRTFAVLFDDIPSRLEHPEDQRRFKESLGRAEGFWLSQIIEKQPANWKGVEWWICPSYYTEDPLLSKTFGTFESHFLENFSKELPQTVAYFWTGPAIVPQRITLAHIRKITNKLKQPLILWDNYPVNDLSMKEEMHLGPLKGRDRRLPELVYGYLNNPLLQENLSFIPLATCFDYAADPSTYNSEESWRRIISEIFSEDAIPYWQTLRCFCDELPALRKQGANLHLPKKTQSKLREAYQYFLGHQSELWFQELHPWLKLLQKSIEA